MEHVVFQWLCRQAPLLDTVHPGIEISTTLLAVKLMTSNPKSDRSALLRDTPDLSPETRFDPFLRTPTLRTVRFFFVGDFKANRVPGEYIFNSKVD